MALSPAYPEATQEPWVYNSGNGPAYYKGTNKPVAVVIHVMQGWANTGVQWARQGYNQASWTFTVRRDGKIWQHLSFADGGYHAGIQSPPKPRPSWKLWKGSSVNVNNYTIGIEHEGFSGEPFPDVQLRASAKLCRWILLHLGQPADRDHVIGHFEVDSVDRPNDPGPTFPWAKYMELVQGEGEEVGMTEAEAKRLRLLEIEVEALRGIVGGPAANQYDLLKSIQNTQTLQSQMADDIKNIKSSAGVGYVGKVDIRGGVIVPSEEN